MKYIKQFEQTKDFKYNVDDYILLNQDEITNYDLGKTQAPLNIDYPFAKIYKLNTKIADKFHFPYTIFLYNDQLTHVREEEIIRKLTPEEIEDFEAKKAALKYNI